MRYGVLASAAAAACIASAAYAQPATSAPSMDQAGVRWTTWPSLKQMSRHYPFRAQLVNAWQGWVDLSCTPDARGRLRCAVVQEWPANHSFGTAALRVMRSARVASVDGGSPAGRTFGYRMRFGVWPPEQLDDKWHPVEAGLAWTERPRLSGEWDLGRTAKNQEYALPFNCTAKADGSLDCAPASGNTAHPRLLWAATNSLKEAKVERLNGGSPEGVRFDYTMKFVRTSNCNAGGDRIEGQSTDSDKSAGGSDPGQKDYVQDPGASLTGGPGEDGKGGAGGALRFRGAGGCKPMILQLR